MSPRASTASLPRWIALVCVAVVVYASLQPFSGWTEPAPGLWSWLDVSRRFSRSDAWLNVLAYVPLGTALSLALPGKVSARRTFLWVLLLAGLLSAGVETAQRWLPTRVSSLADILFNLIGALMGGLLGLWLRSRETMLASLQALRERWIVPGAAGDLQIVLLLVWLAAQINPALPVFGTAFHPGQQAAFEVPIIAIEAIQTSAALIGIGLFADLMMRRRALGGIALLVIIATALLLKWVAAEALLTPYAWSTWLRPGHSLGLALGAASLTVLFWLPRQIKAVLAGIALISSVLVLALVPDLLLATAPMSLFALRFGHLLHLHGLTQAIAMIWPFLATAVLFWRFGREDA